MIWHLLLIAVLASSVGACADPSACIVVDGEYISAKNMAPAYPVFRGLSGETTLSYAPAPGNRRVVSAVEISGWAQSHGFTANVAEGACLERAGIALTADDYVKVIRDQVTVSAAEAKIEVLDFYSHLLPPGRLELPISGAALPSRDHPENPFVWRGQLIASGGASYPVWARVRVLVKGDVVRAVRNFPAASTLGAEELTSAPELVNPFRPGDSKPLSFYVGKSLTRSVSIGSRVDPELVQEAPIIQRGDKVQVSVINGSARLELEALADKAGYVGDSIFFSNPSGSRHFRALITGSGRAELLLNGSAGDAKRATPIPTSSKKGSS